MHGTKNARTKTISSDDDDHRRVENVFLDDFKYICKLSFIKESFIISYLQKVKRLSVNNL